MPRSRWPWIAVLATCALAIALLLVNGYYGYAATVGAVAAAAAVNLV